MCIIQQCVPVSSSAFLAFNCIESLCIEWLADAHRRPQVPLSSQLLIRNATAVLMRVPLASVTWLGSSSSSGSSSSGSSSSKSPSKSPSSRPVSAMLSRDGTQLGEAELARHRQLVTSSIVANMQIQVGALIAKRISEQAKTGTRHTYIYAGRSGRVSGTVSSQV